MQPWGRLILGISTALASVAPLLAGIAAAAQVPPGEAPASPTTLSPGVTVTAKPLHPERPLPRLAPDQFAKCMQLAGAYGAWPQNYFENTEWLEKVYDCAHQLGWQEHTVIGECLFPSDSRALPRIIQACTETLNRNLLQHDERYYLLADRAQAYLAYGDPQHALADYNTAIKLNPSNAKLHYNRALVFAAQSNGRAALQDLDSAIALDSNLVAALLLRAKINTARNDYSGALTDYSVVIRLQPGNAVSWSERGYACLRQHDYKGAIQNESVAIGLDPKLARAYFYRGAAFGEQRDSQNAGSDIDAALRLDPSLDSYLTTKVTSKGKSVSITLPPPP